MSPALSRSLGLLILVFACATFGACASPPDPGTPPPPEPVPTPVPEASASPALVVAAGTSTAATGAVAAETPPAPATLSERLAIPSHVNAVLVALRKDPRTAKLVAAPPGVEGGAWQASLIRSLQQWISARAAGEAWSTADGLSFTGAALAGLVDVTAGAFSDASPEDQAALRAALSADTKVALPVTRLFDPNAGPVCTGATSVCGRGPHAACCGAGQKCCAGGAAGNYYCWNGSGHCPPLP